MSTKTIIASKTTKKKNAVLAFRFAVNPNLEYIISMLEKRFKGLDRAEIMKLALTELYDKISSDKSNIWNIDQILNSIENNPNRLDISEDEFFEKWNANKKSA